MLFTPPSDRSVRRCCHLRAYRCPRPGRGPAPGAGPAFGRRSTHALFVVLACGMILAGRRTVVAMAAAAGMAKLWRACWFFSGAVDADELGMAVARMIVKYLLADGEVVVVAVDGTFFRRWGTKVAQARWAYDGSAQGSR